MKPEFARTEVDLQHHRDMKEFYFKLFNRLPDKCVKRKMNAQARFNFHQSRYHEIIIGTKTPA